MPGNLPVEVASFVDRGTETARLRRLVTETRLVTLVGPPGVGKTRLALRVGAQLTQKFADGVWYVELAHLNDPDLVPHTVIQALELRDRNGRAPLELLADYLNDRQTLLVLDNCEHLLDACRQLAEALTSTTVLATSREPLKARDEIVFSLGPLSQQGAFELFTDRAAAVGAAIDSEQRQQVIAICERLDGLPLAVELTAATTRVLTPNDILLRLDDVFRLLSAGKRTPRQRTLRAAIEWSYALCGPEEQQLWVRLSVFPHDFTREAAEEICDGRVEVLEALVEKSVLAKENGRYRQLDTIRRFGAEMLGDDTRRRHRDHYRKLAEQGRAEWVGPDQLAWITRLGAEHANLRAALDLGGDEGLELAVTLLFYWLATGRHAEGRFWLDRLPAGRKSATALWACGNLAMLQAAYAEADALLTEALQDDVVRGRAAMTLGMSVVLQGDVARGQRLLQDGLALTGELTGTVLNARTALAGTYAFQGELERASAACDEVRAVCEEHGERWALSYNSYLLAVVERLSSRTSRAVEAARQAVRIAHDFGDTLNLTQSVELLAWLASEAQDHERASVLLGGADRLWSAFGGKKLTGAPQYRPPLTEHLMPAAYERGAGLTRADLVAYATREQLTRREREVADLIADGLSNKEIAARLVISRRTAEGHVDRILGKLGFTSRAAVATWVVEQRRQQ